VSHGKNSDQNQIRASHLIHHLPPFIVLQPETMGGTKTDLATCGGRQNFCLPYYFGMMEY